MFLPTIHYGCVPCRAAPVPTGRMEAEKPVLQPLPPPTIPTQVPLIKPEWSNFLFG